MFNKNSWTYATQSSNIDLDETNKGYNLKTGEISCTTNGARPNYTGI